MPEKYIALATDAVELARVAASKEEREAMLQIASLWDSLAELARERSEGAGDESESREPT